MSNKYIFVLILFVTAFVSFFVISSISIKENKSEFDKDYIADSFDFPVGKPNGKGYYNAQKFGENKHLGEDWNGKGGGNTDFGDSLFSIGNGQVIFAEDIKGGWGKVIRVKHKYKGRFYESLYAHCSMISVKKGDWIKKGKFIGKIGNCEGKYLAHLHLEIRDSINMPIGGGYSNNTKGYINPTTFINQNR